MTSSNVSSASPLNSSSSKIEDFRFHSPFSCSQSLLSDLPSPIVATDSNKDDDKHPSTYSSNINNNANESNYSPQERLELNLLINVKFPADFDTPVDIEDACSDNKETENANYDHFISSIKHRKFPSDVKYSAGSEGSSSSLLEHKREIPDSCPQQNNTPPRFPQLTGVADTPRSRARRTRFDESITANDVEICVQQSQSGRSLMDKIAGLDTDRNVLSLLEKMERQVQELKSRYKKINSSNDSEDNNSQISNSQSNTPDGVSICEQGMNVGGSSSGKDADLVDAYLQLNKEVQELIAFKKATTGSPVTLARRNSKMSISSRCESEEWKLEHDYRNSSFSDLNSNSNNSNNNDPSLSAEHFMIKHKYLSLLPIKNNALLVVQKTYSDQSIPEIQQKLSQLVRQQNKDRQSSHHQTHSSNSSSTMGVEDGEDGGDDNEEVDDAGVTVLGGAQHDRKMRNNGPKHRAKDSHSGAVKDHRNESIVNALHHTATAPAEPAQPVKSKKNNDTVEITNPTSTSLKKASDSREKRLKERERRDRNRFSALATPAVVIPSSSLPFVSPNTMPKRLSRQSQLYMFGDSEPTLACSTSDEPQQSPPGVQLSVRRNGPPTARRLHYVSVPDESDEETDRDVTIRLSELPTHSSSLTRVFEVTSQEVFDGMYMQKKYTSNMFFKQRFVWVCPSTRSLHWAKSARDRSENLNSKFLLVRMTRGKLPSGYFQGVVHCLGVSNTGLRLCTESGKFLDLQIPASTVKCWEKVLIALM
mmetsp:Transcript_1164/g.1527  ORF Transcript_1164/g.1527 Transcript_1164/m.1527 type:complete len:761 (+) Transcript_1164:203-2485(+)